MGLPQPRPSLVASNQISSKTHPRPVHHFLPFLISISLIRNHVTIKGPISCE
uniref:Uncharacterized protein n=1 Tax=Arundo donax TaxID=35708 RepID=A0A0A9ACX9_ARUDO